MTLCDARGKCVLLLDGGQLHTESLSFYNAGARKCFHSQHGSDYKQQGWPENVAGWSHVHEEGYETNMHLVELRLSSHSRVKGDS